MLKLLERYKQIGWVSEWLSGDVISSVENNVMTLLESAGSCARKNLWVVDGRAVSTALDLYYCFVLLFDSIGL